MGGVINKTNIIRPFDPGGDYKNEEYAGKTVVDNPPFSILAQIVGFYVENDIDFFLFAPALTTLSTAKRYQDKFCRICVGVEVVYMNGAHVLTSFVTNLEKEHSVESCPELYKRLMELNKKGPRKNPKYQYPDEVLTASAVNQYSKYGINYSLGHGSCAFIRHLDSQKPYKKSIFGDGLLLSKGATRERELTDGRLGKAKGLKGDGSLGDGHIWTLSEREKKLIDLLN